MSEEPNAKKPFELSGRHAEGEAVLSSANELADSQLDAVVGGTSAPSKVNANAPSTDNADVVGGALTAGKVAVPWQIFKS